MFLVVLSSVSALDVLEVDDGAVAVEDEVLVEVIGADEIGVELIGEEEDSVPADGSDELMAIKAWVRCGFSGSGCSETLLLNMPIITAAPSMVVPNSVIQKSGKALRFFSGGNWASIASHKPSLTGKV